MSSDHPQDKLIFKFDNYEWGLRTEWSSYIDAVESRYGGGSVALLSGIDWTLMSGSEFPDQWVGFFHQPLLTSRPLVPLSELKRALIDKAALEKCLGIFVLTKWQRDFLAWERIGVPVSQVYHPVDVECQNWLPDRWMISRRVTFVGRWLRRPQVIQDLVCDGTEKFWLCKQNTAVRGVQENGTVKRLPYLSNEQYDAWLSQSVVMTHVVDAAANNVVMECIARNTPLLINWNSSAVEYLGSDYPLFYSNLREAGWKVNDPAMVLAAHNYLKVIDKKKFSVETFLDKMGSSEVFECIRQKLTPVSNDFSAESHQSAS